MKAWHFCRADRRLGYKDNRILRTGRTYRVKKDQPLVLCSYGLHASERVIDALNYAQSSILCRVELSDGVVHRNDKAVGYSRTVIHMADIGDVLHEFACRCAERALKTSKVTDERCWRAIEIKRRWLAGNATDDELAAASDAAWAASAAAWAASDAARAAASRAAAWAASDAAWAASDAARAAASRAAARRWQEHTLTKLIRENTQLLVDG